MTFYLTFVTFDSFYSEPPNVTCPTDIDRAKHPVVFVQNDSNNVEPEVLLAALLYAHVLDHKGIASTSGITHRPRDEIQLLQANVSAHLHSADGLVFLRIRSFLSVRLSSSFFFFFANLQHCTWSFDLPASPSIWRQSHTRLSDRTLS